jgi:hypothetical protein
MTEYTIPAEEPEDPLGWLVDPGHPEAHRAVLALPGFVVPVIGSGVSVGAGYVSARLLPRS